MENKKLEVLVQREFPDYPDHYEKLKEELQKTELDIDRISLSENKLIIEGRSPHMDYDLIIEPIVARYGYRLSTGSFTIPFDGKFGWEGKYLEYYKYTPMAVYIPGRLVHAIGSTRASDLHINKKELKDILTEKLVGAWELGLNPWVDSAQAVAVMDPIIYIRENFDEKYFKRYLERIDEIVEEELKKEKGKFKRCKDIEEKFFKKYSKQFMFIGFDHAYSSDGDTLALYAAKHPEKPIISGCWLESSRFSPFVVPRKYYRVYDLYLEHELVWDEKNNTYKKVPVTDEAVLNGIVFMMGKEKNHDFDFFSLPMED